MRLRLALVLAAAAAVPALPASAAIYPVCATKLVNADNGVIASCPTKGPGPLGNRNVYVTRTMTVEVATGSVNATLACDGATFGPYTVDAGHTATRTIDGGNNCTVSLTSLADGTSATGTSTFSFVINID
jgi:hypothetical protein